MPEPHRPSTTCLERVVVVVWHHMRMNTNHPRVRHRSVALSILTLFLLFAFAGTALAAGVVPAPQPSLAIQSTQFWTLAIGALVPLVTYVVNHYGQHVDEKIKAGVLVVAAALAGVLYPLAQTGDWSFDTRHLELVGSAVIAALFAHKLLWLPSGISTALGGGSNAQDNPAR